MQYYELWTGSVTSAITITVSALFGNPDVFVSATSQMPNQATYTWGSQTTGSETLVIAADDPLQSAFTTYYVGVTGGAGQSTAYSITVAFASSTVALQANVLPTRST